MGCVDSILTQLRPKLEKFQHFEKLVLSHLLENYNLLIFLTRAEEENPERLVMRGPSSPWPGRWALPAGGWRGWPRGGRGRHGATEAEDPGSWRRGRDTQRPGSEAGWSWWEAMEEYCPGSWQLRGRLGWSFDSLDISPASILLRVSAALRRNVA